VPSNAQFVVFTGENGEGKTALLQAIAIGAYGVWDEQAGLIFDNENLAIIDILFNNNPNEVFNQYRGIKNPYTDIQIIDNFVAYGASRLQLQSPESMEDNKMRHSPVYSLFRTDGVLLNIEHWLKENRGKKDK
jgi:ABC-type sulfate/molybdate transport systems ATPase subunit